MEDIILRAMTSNGAVRAFVTDSTMLCNKSQQIHQTSPVVSAALGRTLTAAAMLGFTLKSDKESLSVQIKGDGPIGGIVAVTDCFSRVRGYVHNADVELPLNEAGKLDVGKAIGKGHLTVIKDFGMKEPYIGRVELQTGEIAEDLTYYFLHSEQIPSAVALGVLVDVDYSIKAAGGLVIQLMPDATEYDISKIEKNIASLRSVTSMLADGMGCEDILCTALEGFEYNITDGIMPVYECNCSRDRLYSVVVSLGKKEIEDILHKQGEAELVCHFCGKKYNFGRDDLTEMLSE